MMRENGLPPAYEALGDRLCADVHKPPLPQLVVLQLQLAGLQRQKDVLRPRHQKPHDRAVLLAYGVEDHLGLDTAQDDRGAARDEAAEPVHLGAGVVERRDEEELVLAGLPMVLLLHDRALREAAMRMQDGLGEARGAAAEIDGRVVVLGKGDHRVRARAIVGEHPVILGEGRAIVAHVEQQAPRGVRGDYLLHAPRELRAEHEHVDIGLIHAVGDLVGGIAEVQRNHHGAALQHAEVDGQPLQAVHEQDGHLVARAHPARYEQVGEAVGLLVEDPPADLAAVGLRLRRLDEVVVTPRETRRFPDGGITFDERHLVAVGDGIAAQ